MVSQDISSSNKEKCLQCICCLPFACKTSCFAPSSLRKIDAFMKHFPVCWNMHALIHTNRAPLAPKEKAVFRAFFASSFFSVSETVLWNPAQTSLLLGFILVTSVGLEAKTTTLKSSLCLLFRSIPPRFKKKKKCLLKAKKKSHFLNRL